MELVKSIFNKIKICIVIGIHNYNESINRVVQIEKKNFILQLLKTQNYKISKKLK
jgi:hypothetical protein